MQFAASDSRPALAHERPFGFEDLFFSTTDRKGIIRAGNRVFSRVAAYDHAEMIGRAHNLIRHPDMPRGAFRLLWDYLQADKPVATYVKNRAKDGGYYWVLATVVPALGGYLSVRFKPSSPHFAAAQALYRELLTFEQGLEATGCPRRQVAEASAARLTELLAHTGYPDYDAFMHAALPAELAGREAAPAGAAGRRAAGRRGPAAVDGRERGLAGVLVLCAEVGGYLDGLFASLRDYADLHSALAGRSDSVRDLASRIRLFSLNALLAASRLHDAAGATLGVVANAMCTQTDSTARLIRALGGDIESAVRDLGDLAFRVSVAKLQTDMVGFFARELLDESAREVRSTVSLGEEARCMRTLVLCLGDGVRRLFVSLCSLDARLRRITEATERMHSDLRMLGALHMNGKIEAGRADSAGFGALYGQIREQIDVASAETADFARVARLVKRGAFERDEGRLRERLARMEACLGTGTSSPPASDEWGAAAAR